jgi:hypothetical protein
MEVITDGMLPAAAGKIPEYVARAGSGNSLPFPAQSSPPFRCAGKSLHDEGAATTIAVRVRANSGLSKNSPAVSDI